MKLDTYIQYVSMMEKNKKNHEIEQMKSKKKKKKIFTFKIGDILRISHLKKIFDK